MTPHEKDLRDKFAARALQGILSDPRAPKPYSKELEYKVAKMAYSLADAMIEARKAKRPEPPKREKSRF